MSLAKLEGLFKHLYGNAALGGFFMRRSYMILLDAALLRRALTAFYVNSESKVGLITMSSIAALPCIK